MLTEKEKEMVLCGLLAFAQLIKDKPTSRFYDYLELYDKINGED